MLRQTATPANERQDQLGENRSRFRKTCVGCSLLRPDPSQRARLTEIRDNLIARIAEAETEGWLGEVEGLQVSLAGAEEKLCQLDPVHGQHTPVDLGIPTTRGDR